MINFINPRIQFIALPFLVLFALSCAKDDPSRHLNLGNWYLQRGLLDEAIMEYMIRYGTYIDGGTATADQSVIDQLLEKFKSFTTSYSKVF